MASPNTTSLDRTPDTGLTDSTHSSSSSAEKYQLDELDQRPILLYKYRGGLKTSSQADLCSLLDKDTNLRLTRKPIPRLTSYLSILRHDLYTPSEKTSFANLPNFDSNLASVKVPSNAYWSRLILGNYEELYIVSPESSPTSSEMGDGEGSRRTSPSSTWGSQEEGVDGRL